MTPIPPAPVHNIVPTLHIHCNPGKAQFGTDLSNGLRIAGTAEKAQPGDGCAVIVNRLAGKVAVMYRGNCMFIDKVPQHSHPNLNFSSISLRCPVIVMQVPTFSDLNGHCVNAEGRSVHIYVRSNIACPSQCPSTFFLTFISGSGPERGTSRSYRSGYY